MAWASAEPARMTELNNVMRKALSRAAASHTIGEKFTYDSRGKPTWKPNMGAQRPGFLGVFAEPARAGGIVADVITVIRFGFWWWDCVNSAACDGPYAGKRDCTM
jgi:hypothetical protein